MLPRLRTGVAYSAIVMLSALITLYVLDWYVGKYVLLPTHISSNCSNPGSFMPKPNCRMLVNHREWGSMVYQINSLGMRDKEYESSVYTKTTTHRKILVLGDSFTLAVGVPQGEEYHAIVGRWHPGLIFLNAAYPGLGIEEEEIVLKHFLPRTNPNMVLIAMLANDLIDFKGGKQERESASTRAERWGLRDLARWVIPYMPQRVVLMARGMISREWIRIYQTRLDAGTDERYAGFIRVVRRMQETLSREEPPIPLAILLIPQVEQVNGFLDGRQGVSPSAPFEHIKARLRGTGITVLDSLPYFLKQENPARLYYAVDRHLTPKGQRVLAEFLDQEIGRLKTLLRVGQGAGQPDGDRLKVNGTA